MGAAGKKNPVGVVDLAAGFLYNRITRKGSRPPVGGSPIAKGDLKTIC